MPYADSSDLVAACDSASRRGRTILVVLVVATILVFSSWWNARPSGWITSHARLAEVMLRIVQQRPVDRVPTKLLERAKKWLEEREWTEEELKTLRRNYERIWIEQAVSVNIPFLGVTVHHNDLGILGGFGFVVILCWFWLALRREHTNLRFAFAQARKTGCLASFYNTLAMRQVLTVPAMGPFERHPFWSKLPKVLFVLPPLVQLLIVRANLLTYETGMLFSPSSAIAALVAGSGTLVLSGVLSGLCVVVSWKIDGVWDEVAKELEKEKSRQLGKPETNSSTV